MKLSKRILLFFSLAVLLNPTTLSLDAIQLKDNSITTLESQNSTDVFKENSPFENKEILYEITSFSTEKNNLNLIINNLFKDQETLFIDAYFLNTTDNITFEKLENFNISIYDASNNELLNKTFESIGIPKGLSPNFGRKILFPIEKEFFNLKNKDLSKISYKFTFDYI